MYFVGKSRGNPDGNLIRKKKKKKNQAKEVDLALTFPIIIVFCKNECTLIKASARRYISKCVFL